MKNTLAFLLELSQLLEIAVQLEGVEQEQAITKTAILYLKQHHLSIATIEEAIPQYQSILPGIDGLTLLLTHLKTTKQI